MYKQFSTQTINQTLDICRTIQERAEQKQFNNWERAIETYDGLMEWLSTHNSLSAGQCAIIKRGCHYNKMPFPQELQDQIDSKTATATQTEPEMTVTVTRKSDTPEPQRVSITQEELTMVFTALAEELAEKAFVILEISTNDK